MAVNRYILVHESTGVVAEIVGTSAESAIKHLKMLIKDSPFEFPDTRWKYLSKVKEDGKEDTTVSTIS